MNNNITYTYDGRGSVYRVNNNNNPHNKSAAYGFQSRQRRGGRPQHHSHHMMPNGAMMNQEQMHPQPEPVWPPNAYPDKLMALLKSSGEYDRLRKQIFTTFQNSDMRKVLLSRVDGVVTECLENDKDVLSRPPDATHATLMKEVDTYPFVGRQVLCVPIWREDEWIAGIERAIVNLIHERPVDAQPPKEPTAPPPPIPPPMVEPPRAPAPWRVKETAPTFVPEEMDQGLGEDDMAIDDD